MTLRYQIHSNSGIPDQFDAASQDVVFSQVALTMARTRAGLPPGERSMFPQPRRCIMMMPGWVADLIHGILGTIGFPGKLPPWHDV